MSSVQREDRDDGADLERRQFVFDRFRSVLLMEGVRSALAYLVGLSDYRYIALQRVEGGAVRHLAYLDRLNPHIADPGPMPAERSYCTFVAHSRQVFRTNDSYADERLHAHPSRGMIRSYCGIPLFDEDGRLIGVMSHWDVMPRSASQLDYLLMLEVAGALVRDGRVS